MLALFVCKFILEVYIIMINIRKRGKVFQYQFEIAPVGGERKQITKSGFKTKKKPKKQELEHIISIIKLGILLLPHQCHILTI